MYRVVIESTQENRDQEIALKDLTLTAQEKIAMSIHFEAEFSCSASDLWAIIGSPGRSDWVPGVTACQLDGDVRRMTMSGAGEVAEKIHRVDDEAMCIDYGVIESRPPLKAHRASMRLEAISSGTRLIWKTEVEPVSVEPFIRKAMEASVAQLRKMLEG